MLFECSILRSSLVHTRVRFCRLEPSLSTFLSTVERVQRGFLSFTGFKLNVLHKLNIQSLADQRRAYDLSFLCNLLCDKTEYPSLLRPINFRRSNASAPKNCSFPHSPRLTDFPKKNEAGNYSFA